MENLVAPQFPIIGIGVAKRGLDTLVQMLPNLPATSGYAFVVIVPLTTNQQGQLVKRLQLYTNLSIVQVDEATRVQPNHLYLAAAQQCLAIAEGSLYPQPPLPGAMGHDPIDFFFRSLAADQADAAVGLLLGGTGKDGVAGLQAIKASGGQTQFLAPQTTHYPVLLRRALATGSIDMVAPLDKLVMHWVAKNTADILALRQAHNRFERAERTAIDITEREQTEYTLRESEARLRLGISVAGLGIAEISYLTNLIHLSAEAATLFGLPADTGVTARTTIHTLFHPDDRTEIFRRIDAALAPTGPGWFEMEHRIVRPDGIVRWLSVRKQIFFEADAGGAPARPVRALLAALDITERKWQELNQQFLLDLDTQVRLLDKADVIAATTAQTLGQYLGVTHCTFNEIDEDAEQGVVLTHWQSNTTGPDLTGQHKLSTVLEPEMLAALMQGQNVIINDIEQDARTAAFITRYSTAGIKSIARVPFKLKGAQLAVLAVADEQPRVWRADEVALLTAVIARVWPLVIKSRIEATLHERNALIEGLMASTPDLIWAKDRAGRMILGNQATLQLLGGGNPEQVLGYSATELVPDPEQAQQILKNDERIMRTGAVEVVEETFGPPDQTLVFRTTKAPLRDHIGAVIGIVGISTDITQQKRREATQRFLAALGETLVQLLEPEELLWTVAQQLGEFLDVARCCFMEIDWAQQQVIIHRNYHRPDFASLAGIYALSDFHPQNLAQHGAGHTIVINDTAANPTTADREPQRYAEHAVRATVTVPLLRNGQWVVTLAVAHHKPRHWTEEEVNLIQTVAERVWLAVENVRLQAALRASEATSRQQLAELEAIYKTAPVGLCVMDKALRYVRINERLATMNGLPAAEHIGRTGRELFPDLANKTEEMLQRVLATGEAVIAIEITGELPTQPGVSHTWVESWLPLQTPGGEVSGINIVIEEITERKRAEEFLRQIADNVPGLVGYLGADERYHFVNAAFEAWFQRPRQQIVGSTVLDLLGEQDRARLTLYRQQAFMGKTVSYEEIFTYPDGVTRHIWGRYQPDIATDGSVAGLYIFVMDISERKQAEIALAERGTFLRAITDAVPNLIGYIDRHRRYRFVNATYAQWFARPREEIEGSTMAELLGKHLDTWRTHWARALAGERVHFEETFTYPDGVTRTVMGAYIPDVSGEGEVLGFYLYINDITARKRAEEALAARETELRVITDNAPGWISYVDKAQRYRFVNAAYEKLYQQPRDQLIGQDLCTLLGEASYRPIQPYVLRALQGEFVRFENTIAHPGGARTVWVTYVPNVDDQGIVHGFYSLITDISERKRAEQALLAFNERLDQEVKERTAELTKRLRELDQFAYVTSHDLKAPLRAIDHLAHWINADAAHLLPPSSRNHLERMRGRINRMEKLLDDLLAYSRADRFEYSIEQVDVGQLLDNIVRLVTPPEGFTVHVQTLLPVLRTQKVPLETVLRNLINNAIKHHHRRDGQIWVAAHDLGDAFEFSVADDGPGIAPQYHEKIFQIFQTLKPRDDVEGSGMGLAIVKKIIEARSGTITVESNPDQGATFRFTWPKG